MINHETQGQLFNVSLDAPKEHEIRFCINGYDPLILEADGFTYNGVKIKDAGEAYALFTDFFTKAMKLP